MSTSSTHELECWICLLYMKENKVKIELEVYDELIEVYANKSDVKRYNDAAKLVTDRYNTYAELFREKKSHHTIALITMLDIAVKYMPYNTYKGLHHSFWVKMKGFMSNLSLLTSQAFARKKL